MNLDDAIKALWLTKSHWANFHVLDGEKLALQAGAWVDVLADIELPDVRAALAELDAAGHDFAPTPGQIRTAILAQRGVVAPDWDQAFAEVLQSARRYGTTVHYGAEFDQRKPRPPLSHPAIEETVKAMGGWSVIGMSENLDVLRAHFRGAYEAAARRADREATMPPIVRQINAAAADAMALPPAPVVDPVSTR